MSAPRLHATLLPALAALLVLVPACGDADEDADAAGNNGENNAGENNANANNTGVNNANNTAMNNGSTNSSNNDGNNTSTNNTAMNNGSTNSSTNSANNTGGEVAVGEACAEDAECVADAYCYEDFFEGGATCEEGGFKSCLDPLETDDCGCTVAQGVYLVEGTGADCAIVEMDRTACYGQGNTCLNACVEEFYRFDLGDGTALITIGLQGQISPGWVSDGQGGTAASCPIISL